MFFSSTDEMSILPTSVSGGRERVQSTICCMIQLPTPRPRGKNSFSINSTLNSSTVPGTNFATMVCGVPCPSPYSVRLEVIDRYALASPLTRNDIPPPV